jgi:hypothetical protein
MVGAAQIRAARWKLAGAARAGDAPGTRRRVAIARAAPNHSVQRLFPPVSLVYVSEPLDLPRKWRMPASIGVSPPAGVSTPAAMWVPSLRRVPSGGSFARPGRAARARLERRAGFLLRSMRGREAYRTLGASRGSPTTSRRGWGVSLRGAQEMMRTDEALEGLPLAGAHFEAGAITAGHVRLPTRVATPLDEAYWVGLAPRMTVRQLGRAVAARACDAGACAGGTGALGDSGEPDDRVRHDIPAPGWIAGWWRDTAGPVSRSAGSPLPAGEAFGMVAADVDSGGLGAGSASRPGADGNDAARLPSSASWPKCRRSKVKRRRFYHPGGRRRGAHGFRG